MGRQLKLDDQGNVQFFEGVAGGTNKVTVQAPTTLAADYTLTLPVDDGTSGQFLSTDGAGVLSWGTGTSSLDSAYDAGGSGTGRIITADSGPVEAAGSGGVLVSHSAPVYGLETTGLEHNFRLTAGQAANVLEIQRGDQDADISDDTFDALFSLDGANRRLGLNTAAPGSLVHLVSPSGAAQVEIEAPATTDASVVFDEGGTNRWELGYDQSAGGLVIGRLSFTNPVVFVEDTTEDIGIGTITPAAKVDLLQASDEGAILVTKTGTGVGVALSVHNDGTGNAFKVVQDGIGVALQVDQNAAAEALNIDQEGDGTVATLVQRGPGSSYCLKLDIQNSGKGLIVDNNAANDGIQIDQNGNGIALNIDSEATGQPLINLAPLNTNTRGDITFAGTARTADPSGPSNGDIWYDGQESALKGRFSGVTRYFGSVINTKFVSSIHTISAGSITLSDFDHVIVAAESGTTDDLTDIAVPSNTAWEAGAVILLSADTGDTITVKHATGNIRLDGGTDKGMNVNDSMLLRYDGTDFLQMTPHSNVP